MSLVCCPILLLRVHNLWSFPIETTVLIFEYYSDLDFEIVDDFAFVIKATIFKELMIQYCIGNLQ